MLTNFSVLTWLEQFPEVVYLVTCCMVLRLFREICVEVTLTWSMCSLLSSSWVTESPLWVPNEMFDARLLLCSAALTTLIGGSTAVGSPLGGPELLDSAGDVV